MILKPIFLFILLIALQINTSHAQRIYHSSELNMIFSFAEVKTASSDYYTTPRFAPFFNIGQQVHFDAGNLLGLSTGLELKNIGLSIKDTLKSKHKATSIGAIITAKIGNMQKEKYFYAGATYEYLFGYKEKLFVNNEKIKRKNYYTKDVNPFNPSLLVGFNIKGFNIRFQYFLKDYFSPDYQFINHEDKKSPSFTDSKLVLLMVGFRKTIGKKNDDDDEDFKDGKQASNRYRNK